MNKQYSSHHTSGKILPDAQFNSLVDQFNRGQYDIVIEEAGRLARVFPDDYLLHHLLASAFAATKNNDQAIASYRTAIEINPSFAEAHNGLGIALRAAGRLEDATESYAKALELAPQSAEIHNNLGNAFKDLRRHSEAVKAFKQALGLKPNFAVAWKNLGVAYNETGRADEAVNCYMKALALQPDYGEAHYGLSAIKRYDENDPHLLQMSELMSSRRLSYQNKMLLSFALGKAKDDIGETREAFELYSEGNRLRKAELIYDISKDREHFAAIRRLFQSCDRPELKLSTKASKHKSIFIIGMPRSGTTLVEQILSSHSDVYGGGELMLINEAVQSSAWRDSRLESEKLEKIGAYYLAGLKKLGADEPYVTDKMPQNFMWLGFILTAIPQAKIIHVKRDARATCWSIFKQNFNGNGNGFAYDLSDITAFYKLYMEYMRFWRKIFPDRIYNLSYERLTENQEQETRELLGHIGLEWQNECLEFFKSERPVATASANQIRQKIYAGSSNAWRRFEGYLGPMAAQLEDC